MGETLPCIIMANCVVKLRDSSVPLTIVVMNADFSAPTWFYDCSTV
jgi:hypothetical protein